MSTPLGLNSNDIYPLHEANREYAQSQVPRSVADGGVNSHKLTTDDALSYLKDVSRSRGQLSCVRSLGIAGFLSLEVLDLLVNALTHNNADVRTAACICFRNAHVMLPLVQLLHDPSSSVQGGRRSIRELSIKKEAPERPISKMTSTATRNEQEPTTRRLHRPPIIDRKPTQAIGC
ncbi:hypothetical protein F2Q69_00026688 [Brassica cretica]|uniref:Uncharacterized protein n=1 Tax=Brassica cretica TaxID=69181 RepID=A0A8S9RXR1_BRACR|nr:hypothetical protein F2Q69_00026688 [Brassica cretica]